MMKRVASFLLLTAIVFLLLPLSSINTGCLSGCDEATWGYLPGIFDRYQVSADYVTPGGTHYDPSGQNISPQLIDRLTHEVESCLLAEFPSGRISDHTMALSGCTGNAVLHPINRTSFLVKIANDWSYTCDMKQEVLPVSGLGDAGCIAKGETPTVECPCRPRAGIKCPNVLIVTPSFYIYKDVLIRFLLDCTDPWASPELAICASPSTTPTSDGSDPNNGL